MIEWPEGTEDIAGVVSLALSEDPNTFLVTGAAEPSVQLSIVELGWIIETARTGHPAGFTPANEEKADA